MTAGRRTKIVRIEDETSRDDGRSFLLTEMPCPKAEKWGMKCVNGLAKAGVNIEGVRPGMGAFAMVVLGIDAIARMPWELAEPLIDEMFECVQFVMESGQPRRLTDGDIEEVSTRLKLREEVATLHLGFSIREKLQELREQLQAVNHVMDTQTSPMPSDL